MGSLISSLISGDKDPVNIFLDFESIIIIIFF